MFDDEEEYAGLPSDLDTYVGWEWMVAAAMLVMLEFDLSVPEVCALNEGDYDTHLKRLRIRGEWCDVGASSCAMLDEVFRMTNPRLGLEISGAERHHFRARDAARPLFWRPPDYHPINEQLLRAIAALRK